MEDWSRGIGQRSSECERSSDVSLQIIQLDQQPLRSFNRNPPLLTAPTPNTASLQYSITPLIRGLRYFAASDQTSFGTMRDGSIFPSMASRQFLAATTSIRSAHSRVSDAECGDKITFSKASNG
jgi:hypothetical protein